MSQYTYEGVYAASEKVTWQVEDLIGGDKQLDFTRPFLPESLARVKELAFLSPEEQRVLNQIRGHAYLCTFGLAEEFILPFVLDHTRPQLREDDYAVRALLQFAGEEAKHIQLFKRFCEEFERGFPIRCGVIGPPEAVAKEILAHDPLAVALVILHIEWMTQRHYIDSVKDDQDLDPQFKSLLRHHWMEEAQHAKLDTLMVESLAQACDREQLAGALGEYLEIGGFLDRGFEQQMEMDLDAFQRAVGRVLPADDAEEFRRVQRQANRWTYLGSGMTHPNFLGTLERLDPALRAKIEEIAPIFC